MRLTYTRAEFLTRIRKLLDDFEKDHEEHTGITEDDKGFFDFWIDEIINVEENTS